MARSCLPLAFVLLVAGCGGTGPTIAKARLQQLVLQPADVGPGFVRTAAGPIDIADTDPGPRESLSRFGRLGGWKARYAKRAGRATIASFADLFKTAAGARKDLDAYGLEFADAEVEGIQVSVPVPKIGNGAVGTTIAVGGRRQYRIAWRFGNVTASVDVQAQSDTLTLGRALTLARRQQRRIERAAR